MAETTKIHHSKESVQHSTEKWETNYFKTKIALFI